MNKILQFLIFSFLSLFLINNTLASFSNLEADFLPNLHSQSCLFTTTGCTKDGVSGIKLLSSSYIRSESFLDSQQSFNIYLTSLTVSGQQRHYYFNEKGNEIYYLTSFINSHSYTTIGDDVFNLYGHFKFDNYDVLQKNGNTIISGNIMYYKIIGEKILTLEYYSITQSYLKEYLLDGTFSRQLVIPRQYNFDPEIIDGYIYFVNFSSSEYINSYTKINYLDFTITTLTLNSSTIKGISKFFKYNDDIYFFKHGISLTLDGCIVKLSDSLTCISGIGSFYGISTSQFHFPFNPGDGNYYFYKKYNNSLNYVKQKFYSLQDHEGYDKICALENREVINSNLERTKISVLYPNLQELINYDDDVNTIHYGVDDDVYVILYNPDLQNYNVSLNQNGEIYYLTINSKTFFETRNNYFIFNIDVSKMNGYKFYSNISEIGRGWFSDRLTSGMLKSINLNEDLDKILSGFDIKKIGVLTQNYIIPSINFNNFIFENNLTKEDDYVRVELLLFKKLYDEVEVCGYYPDSIDFTNMDNKQKLDYINNNPSDFEKTESVLKQFYENPLIINPEKTNIGSWEDENGNTNSDFSCDKFTSNLPFLLNKPVSNVCQLFTNSLPTLFGQMLNFNFSTDSSIFIPTINFSNGYMTTNLKEIVINNNYTSGTFYTKEIVQEGDIKYLVSKYKGDIISKNEINNYYYFAKAFILLIFLLLYILILFLSYIFLLFPILGIVYILNKFSSLIFPSIAFDEKGTGNVFSLIILFIYYTSLLTLVIVPILSIYTNVGDVALQIKNFTGNYLNNIYITLFDSSLTLRDIVSTFNIGFYTIILTYLFYQIINKYGKIN